MSQLKTDGDSDGDEWLIGIYPWSIYARSQAVHQQFDCDEVHCL